MLFNSYLFILIFLPIVLIGFSLLSLTKKTIHSISWLVVCSLFFYGWWNPAYLSLLIFSILVNFAIGKYLRENKSTIVLIFGLVFNIGLIAYYKYANFFIDNFNVLFGVDYNLSKIILPLAVSFFTFQQIAYLVDAYRGKTDRYKFIHYCLFVTFFPQLIAGPIVHHKEILPQFNSPSLFKIKSSNLAIGISIFAIGLFKKVFFADSISVYASPVFDAAYAGSTINFFEAWFGSVAYSVQLYFDFSGYSDMAIGLATMFGFKLPVNFYSPYKANNIADFWRRWHITLSRLIREYLWDPISLFSTRISIRRKDRTIKFFIITIIVPTIFTFFWVGLWHGAGWNFILFGLLHGLFIVLFNLWSRIKQSYSNVKLIKNKIFATCIARFITFIAVTLGWVLFRSESFSAATNIYKSMFGLNKISISDGFQGFVSNGLLGNNPKFAVSMIILLVIFTMLLPNTQQMFRKFSPYIITYDGEKSYQLLNHFISWRANYFWCLFISTLIVVSILFMTRTSEFLYFQF